MKSLTTAELCAVVAALSTVKDRKGIEAALAKLTAERDRRLEQRAQGRCPVPRADLWRGVPR